MITLENELGTEIRTNSHLYFLGNRCSTPETLRSKYPSISFAFLNQSHGNNIVHQLMAGTAAEGDAHWTQTEGLGLCVKTADCIPILVSSRASNHIASIHAGWRGISNRIVPKCLDLLLQRGVSPSDLEIFIGPHILRDSFEVSAEALESLRKSTAPERTQEAFTPIRSKWLVDLDLLLEYQLAEFSIKAPQVHSIRRDTKSDPNYHSYRRDKERSGRQLSFVARLDSKDKMK